LIHTLRKSKFLSFSQVIETFRDSLNEDHKLIFHTQIQEGGKQMKRCLITAMVFCTLMLSASPATAVDVDFSGHFSSEWFYTKHVALDDTRTTESYLLLDGRAQTVFKVSDDLKLTTRLNALDTRWGDTDSGVAAGLNIDLDRFYVTVKTKYGILDIGRMSGGRLFGTSFVDPDEDREETDMVQFAVPVGDLTVLASYEKRGEGDWGANTPLNAGDLDSYNLAAIYKRSDNVGGVLFNYEDDTRKFNVDRDEFFVNPFFDAKFHRIALQGEMKFAIGEISTKSQGVETTVDVNRLAANLEANVPLGSVNISFGYAFMQGDGDPDDNEDNSFLGGTGEGWGKLWILTGSTDETHMALLGGGASPGNLTANTGGATPMPLGAALHGAEIFYLGLSVSPKEMEDLTVGVIYGSSKAHEPPQGYGDTHGKELDFTLDYQLRDNLSYSFVAAVLAPGDYWKGNDPALRYGMELAYSFYHELKLKF